MAHTVVEQRERYIRSYNDFAVLIRGKIWLNEERKKYLQVKFVSDQEAPGDFRFYISSPTGWMLEKITPEDTEALGYTFLEAAEKMKSVLAQISAGKASINA